MEDKKVKYNKIPDIIGKYEDDARDYLSKRKIKVKRRSVKKFNLAYKSGTVIKTVPEPGTKVKENETVKLYVAENRLFTIFLAIVVILLSVILTYGYKLSYVMMNTEGPYIKAEYSGYVKTNVVKVISLSELDNFTNYQYCVTSVDSFDKCVWNNIDTDFVTVSDSGKWYVYFRAYNSNNKKYSLPSNSVQVLIDREGPEIKTTYVKNKDKITIEIDAKDNLSGIKAYLYSIDGSTYLDTTKRFDLNTYELEKVYVKVIDQLDNETIKEIII